MNSLKLLITDTSFILTEKSKPVIEHSFTNDDDFFKKLTDAASKIKIKNIECVFTGSKIITKTIRISHNPGQPFTADAGLLDRLIETVRHTFLEEHKDSKLEIVIEDMLSTKLNGYSVNELKKTKVDNLDVSLFIGAIPVEFKKKLLFALGIQEKSICYKSAAKKFVDTIFEKSREAAFITCSAYELSTDIAVRKKECVFEVITVPIGSHHAYEYIMKEFNLHSEDVESLVALHEKNKLGVEQEDKIETALRGFQTKLDEGIMTALIQLADGFYLPTSVFLLVSPQFKDLFGTIFNDDKYIPYTTGGKGFEVKDMSSIIKT